MAFSLERIDWGQPWFAGWRGLGPIASELVEEHSNVYSALNAVHGSVLANDSRDSTGLLEDISSTHSANSEGDTVRAHTRFAHQIARASATLTLVSGCTKKFVSQSELSSDIAYEAFIYSHKRIPTRDNLHDFLNGLCWLRFPQTKSRLNFLQAQEITSQGVGATRGPLRDALTLFDENVLLLQSSDELWQACHNSSDDCSNKTFSSNKVKASRKGPRVAPTPWEVISCACRKFKRDLVCGKRNQHKPFKKS